MHLGGSNLLIINYYGVFCFIVVPIGHFVLFANEVTVSQFLMLLHKVFFICKGTL